jgi:hypothetical protein
MEWESIGGVSVDHALVGGGDRGNVISDRWSRVITRPSGQAGPAADTISTPEGSPAPAIGHWSDVLNFHGSPMPWILVALIAIVFISHLKFRGGAAIGLG